MVSLRRLSLAARSERSACRAAPFAVGGASDVLARLIAEPMREGLGQPVIVENVAGASGSIGVGRAAKAPADGYTLSLGSVSSHVLTGALYSLQWNLIKDFDPIALLVHKPLMIVTRKSLPVDDLVGLIDWAKANPEKAMQGIAGVGGAGHWRRVPKANESTVCICTIPWRWASTKGSAGRPHRHGDGACVQFPSTRSCWGTQSTRRYLNTPTSGST
jgi:tripartite-type tricarboxylate transporter receptor subunit TctC